MVGFEDGGATKCDEGGSEVKSARRREAGFRRVDRVKAEKRRSSERSE